MHAIHPPIVTRVDVQDQECRVALAFPDDAGAIRFGHGAAALLDQDVDVDIAPASGTHPQETRPAEGGGNGGASTPSEAEMLARGIRHDLQDPLTVVRSYLDLVLDRDGSDLPDEVRDHLEAASDGAERLQAMIEGIGALGERSKVREPRPVDLDDVLDMALQDLAGRLDRSSVVLERSALPRVRADPGSLARVLGNLVENVLDHADGAGRVQVDAARDGDAWRVRVADDGPGVPKGEQDWIFDPLRRGAGAKGAGGGVGLSVCRRVIEAHGGEIGVDSAPGQGATFWFTLPGTDSPES